MSSRTVCKKWLWAAVCAASPVVSADAAILTWNNASGDNAIAANGNWVGGTRPNSPNEGVIDDRNVSVSSTLFFGTTGFTGGTLGRFTLNSDTITAVNAGTAALPASQAINMRFNGDQAAGATGPVTIFSLGSAITHDVSISDTATGVLSFQLGQTQSVIEVANAAASLTINSKVQSAGGGAFGLTKSGAGTLILKNTGNTFGTAAAGIRITGGTLSFDSNGQLGATAAGIALDGGTLQTKNTAALSLTRTITVTNAGGGIDTFGLTPLNNANNVTVSNLAGSGTLTKTGIARLILSATATNFTGNLVIKQGSVQVRNTGSLQASSAVKLDGTQTDNATLDLRADVDTNFGQNVEITNYGQVFVGNIAAGTVRTNTLGNVSLASGATFFSNGTTTAYGLNTGAINLGGGSATISTRLNLSVASINDAGASTALTKVGAGTLTIQGADAHAGATTVLEGTIALAPTATMANTTGIDVRKDATFDVSALSGFNAAAIAGGGTVRGNVTAASVNATGALTVDGDLTVTGNTTFDIAALDSFDSLTDGAAAHTLSLGGVIVANFGEAVVAGDTFKVIDFDTFTTTATFAYTGASEATFDQDTGVITVTAVPEPGAMSVLGMGALALLRRKRRR